jgi:hypothetical protein
VSALLIAVLGQWIVAPGIADSWLLAGLVIFALVYLIAARLIVREEYGYVMRAISQGNLRRTAA